MKDKKNDWKPITDPSFKPGWYYDFKLKDGTIVLGGMFRKGKYGDKYGMPIPRPLYFREHSTYKVSA